MACRYEIDPAQNLVTINYNGVVSVGELITFVNTILSDSHWRKDMNSLSDLTHGIFDWSLDELDTYRKFVLQIRDRVGQSRWAVITAGGPTDHTARIFTLLYAEYDKSIVLKIFTNRKDALEWLAEVNVAVEND